MQNGGETWQQDGEESGPGRSLAESLDGSRAERSYRSRSRHADGTLSGSGIVSEQVWANHLGLLATTTLLAFGWILGYSLWARRRDRGWIADTLLCMGFGATAWALPYILLGYTIDDHWEGGSPSQGIASLGEGSCGLQINPLGLFLVIGGFLGIAARLIWIGVDRRRTESMSLAPEASNR